MPSRLRLLLPALLLICLADGGLAGTDLYRVHLRDAAALNPLLAEGFDIVQVHPRAPGGGESAPPAVDLFTHRDDLDRLIRLGYRPTLIQRDMEQFYASRLGPLSAELGSGPPNFGQGSMGGYYTWAEAISTFDHYRTTYPSIVSAKQAIGTSHQGRTIWAYKISDNPDQTENEPRVLFDALHHAREPMSMHTMLWFVDHLCVNYGSDAEITDLIDHREIWFVPVVNPDGYVYNQQTNPNGGGLWRKNRRNGSSCDGVDLNRNWPTAWAWDSNGSSGSECSDVYRGPSAGSEPEVQALNGFMTGKNFRTAWSMHTHGEWMVEPYGYRSASPGPVYAEYSADMVAFNGYTAGVGYDLLYPANGISIDHYNDFHGAIAYTPEIGTSFWPPVNQMVPTAQINVEPALLMVKYAGSWLTSTGTDLTETVGNGNGLAEPGEELDLVLDVRNKGQEASGNVLLDLSSPSADVVILSGSASIPSVPSLGVADNSFNPLQIRIDAAALAGANVDLTLQFSYDGLQHETTVPLTIGAPRVILRDLLETELGWIIGAAGDSATTGIWERVNPNQVTNGGAVTQPGNDATPPPGVRCYVTGNDNSSAGADDVDDGRTTLTTPTFDLSSAASPRLRYMRHYYCSTGEDPFTIDISNNGGTTWKNVETVTGQQNQWTGKEWRISDILAPSGQMQVRFRAVDSPNNSLTEACVDDFEILDFANTPHLGAFGTPAIGSTFELQIAAAAGSDWFLLGSNGTGSLNLPGIVGTLGLDLGSLVILGGGTVPADGLTRLPLSLPNDGGLIGQTGYFQALLNLPPRTFSNVASVTVE